jgi:hypothetical protein
MAIPSVGGGFQLGDGNLNEVWLGEQADVQTATSTATLTAAQVTGGILVGSPSTTAASYTFPTGAAIDAVLTNAKIGSTFDLVIVNLGTSTGVITALASTGVTIVGQATFPTAAAGSSGQFRFRRTAAATWVAYRIV